MCWVYFTNFQHDTRINTATDICVVIHKRCGACEINDTVTVARQQHRYPTLQTDVTNGFLATNRLSAKLMIPLQITKTESEPQLADASLLVDLIMSYVSKPLLSRQWQTARGVIRSILGNVGKLCLDENCTQ